jgi:hypothetical protein
VQPKQNISPKCKVVPDSFLLVPEEQGGSLSEVCKYGMNACGIADKFITRNHMLQAVLILQKSKSRSVENANGANFV